MADEKYTAKADTKAENAKVETQAAPKADQAAQPKAAPRRATAEAKKDDAAEAEAGRDLALGRKPWAEDNEQLDNRHGDQKVPDEAWAPKPQHVDGPEIGGKQVYQSND